MSDQEDDLRLRIAKILANGTNAQTEKALPAALRELDPVLRTRMTKLLEYGAKDQTQLVPEDGDEYAAVLAALQELAPDDLEGKLKLAGLVNRPYGKDPNGTGAMRCQECMYYLLNRKWCDQPQLALPVGPNWWCRLWRI